MCVGLSSPFTPDFLAALRRSRWRRLHRLLLRLYFRRARVCRVSLAADPAELDASRVDVCDCRLLARRCATPVDYCYKLDRQSRRASAAERPPPGELARRSDAAPRRGLVRLRVATLGRRIEHCHCCACCCQALLVERALGPGCLVPSGQVPRTGRACRLCGRCVAACPVGARRLGATDVRRCIGCGLCLSRCPRGALALRPAVPGEQPGYWTPRAPGDDRPPRPAEPERRLAQSRVLAHLLSLLLVAWFWMLHRRQHRHTEAAEASGRRA